MSDSPDRPCNPDARPARARGCRPCPPAEQHAAFLAQLGERVRTARARRGMTRKILAHESGVSERYLAQLEGGQGNISIGLLRQVAQAMNLALETLVREAPEPPAELALIQQILGRLSPEELTEAQALLGSRFGSRELRGRRIALIGLRGAGKSTLGARLAERLDVPFIELAQAIEADAGMAVGEIFSLSGQSGYRRAERRSLDRVLDDHPEAVIATGGGIVAEPATYERLLASCLTVWLKARPEDHMERVIAQGDYRPMAGSSEAMEDLRQILASREELYGKASLTFDTSGRGLEDTLDALQRAIVALIAAPRAA
ncbi:helix-turn-helix transcriptional regulator [Oceanibacterium hippocampi]|uniref:Shikimate kinase n=1 Tax=Oceanibacterium hippocampi TaxID=745714 RepID=A0A1Y5SCY1_9PROT|nr:helix-turn-helix transcriptional regulator [Oceanibacterium hippocampi]SLN37924.1 Shikimate kinase [Oceanibacterium hippocampi]